MKKYWIVFDKGKHWTRFFTKRNYGHMFVITQENNAWMCLNPLKQGLEIETLKLEEAPDLIQKLQKNYQAVVYVETEPHRSKSFLSVARPSSCVEFIKYIVGIKVFCVTPYSFYKRLWKWFSKGTMPVNVKQIKFLL